MIPKILGSLCLLGVSLVPMQAQDLLFTNNFNGYFSNTFNTSGFTNARAVAHDGSNTWVAVGDGANVMRIEFTGSGYNVTSQSLNTNASLNAIIFLGTNNTFLAGGRPMATNNTPVNAPLLMISTDGGMSWSPATAPNFGTVPIQGLAFDSGSNRMVAVGALKKIAYADGTGPAFIWTTNTILDGTPFVFESFSSVLSLGGGRFVTTGIAEGMRYSTNNGVNWGNGNPVVSLDDANMNGSGPDGIKLVAVGQQGRVLESTNSGISWNTDVTSPVTNNLNSIVSLGNNLTNDGNILVAGDGGIVLRRTNETAWTATTVAASNLRGSFFAANSGSDLTGTGVMIGDNATVVITGTRPAHPTNTPTALNPVECNDASPTILNVTNINDANHPPNTSTVDWYAADGTTLLQAGTNSGNTSFTTNAVSANVNAATIFTFVAKSRDLRTGFESGNGTNGTLVQLTINPRPSLTLNALAVTNCNLGLTNLLTGTVRGIGPWTMRWNDGTTQVVTNIGSGPVNFSRAVVATNTLPNAPATTLYFVTNLVDANCVAIPAIDLFGTNTVTVNPRPTAVLTSVNRTNCNDGTPYVLQAALTGIGPWHVLWNDGTPQTTNAAPGSGAVLTRTVIPTNAPGANVASNNVYYVTSVTNLTSCMGNQLGDIVGTNTVTVNPRPTAVLTSVNRTNCNDGTPYVLQAALTGIGPWHVLWNDGTPQTTNAAPGSGAVLTRTVIPTNAPGANVASNNVYYVTSVTNLTSCVGNQPGDIVGTNTVTVNPRPTAVLTSVNRTNCNDGTPYVLQAALTGIGPWHVLWNDGTPQTTNAAPGSGAVLTRTVIPTNAPGANVASNNVYYVTSVTNLTSCVGNQPGDIVGTNTVTVNPRPSSTLNALVVTNCNLGLTNLLTGTVRGVGPWTMRWNDGTTQVVATAGSGPVNFSRAVVATNPLPNQAVTTLYYLTNLVDANCEAIPALDLFGTNSVTVNPLPLATNLAATICSRGQVMVALQSAVSNGVGSSFRWVTTNNLSVSGESTALVTNGLITDFLTNVTAGPVLVGYTVTPTSTNGGCEGSPFTVVVTVNPEPVGINLTNAICSGESVGTVLTNLQNAITNGVVSNFRWRAESDAAFVNGESLNSVTNNVITDTLTNTNTQAGNVKYIVTPTSTNGCQGSDFIVFVVVNPELTVTSVSNQSQILCSGDSTQPVTINSSGASYIEWVKNGTNVLLGPVTGGGNLIPSFVVTNTGTAPVTNTITITPHFTNEFAQLDCPGVPTNVTIIVYPSASVTSVFGTNQIIEFAGFATNSQQIMINGSFTEIAWSFDKTTISSAAPTGSASVMGMYNFPPIELTNTGTLTITFTLSNSIAGGPNCPGAPVIATIEVVSTNNLTPAFTIQSLNSSNVVLEWYSPSNTLLLSATNLNPPNWTSNGTFNPGTNKFTNSILLPPPYRFFRLTNAP